MLRGPRVTYPARQRDRLLDDFDLLDELKANAEYFRRLAQKAYDFCHDTLAEAAARTSRSPGSLVPEAEECALELAEVLYSNAEWNRILTRELPLAEDRFVRQVTDLAADFLIEAHWHTLVLRSP